MHYPMIAQAWIGCLACYNTGDLIGLWVDAPKIVDVTDEPAWLVLADQAKVWTSTDARKLHVSEGHEELWVFDHDSFGGFIDSECSPTEAARIWALIENVEGVDRDALRAYLLNWGEELTEESIASFEEAYLGEHDSEADYAQGLMEDIGGVDKDNMLMQYIDWDRFARDLFMDGYWSQRSASGRVHVFHRL